MNKPKLIVITGPTASGKSALAVSLAEKLHTEIISADSRQIYKGIPIVTAVPTLEERHEIKHHLLEILPLDGYYSAAKFQEDSDILIKEITKKSGNIIICGGSMLYLDALTKGIDDLPTVPKEIRDALMNEWETKGDKWLLSQLQLLDPNYYDKIDHRNLKRVFHAIEISITASKPYSSLLSYGKTNKELPYDITKFCLTGERTILFNRINDRVSQMIRTGLEEEARSVYPLRYLNSLNTVGLKEMFDWFDGKLKKEEAISRIQKNTRVYAKKQLTWHKRDHDINYLDLQDGITYNINKILNKI